MITFHVNNDADSSSSNCSPPQQAAPPPIAPLQSISLSDHHHHPIPTNSTVVQRDNNTPSVASATSELTLSELPDDVLLRIMSHTGEDASIQIGVAYRLGAVNVRLNRLLKQQFLSSITNFSPGCLQSLSLSDSTAAHSALMSLFSHTTSLRDLNLSGCTPSLISEQVMSVLSTTASTTLQSVNLAYCRLDDKVLKPLLINCKNLKKMCLTSCHGPTGKAFHKKTCISPLKLLDLTSVTSLSVDGLKAIGSLSTIENLILKGCDIVCNNMDHLISYDSNCLCQSLVSITLTYCLVRNSGLFNLVSNSPNLTTLILAGHSSSNQILWPTGEFSQDGIQTLRQKFPNVEVRFST